MASGSNTARRMTYLHRSARLTSRSVPRCGEMAVVGMCAIYTAIKPPSPEELVILARDNEARTYGPQRCTVGRKAIAQLVQLVAPPSHAELAAAIFERDLWGF